MQPITPMLWFNGQAEDAARFYTSVFRDASMGAVSHYGKGMPFPEGTAMVASFTLNGQKFTALNGGPHFSFNESVSFIISCRDQEEVDHYWNALTADGGQESQCGWLKDKYGLSWQVTPEILQRLMAGPESKKTAAMMQAMMTMKKLDVAALEKAYNEG